MIDYLPDGLTKALIALMGAVFVALLAHWRGTRSNSIKEFTALTAAYKDLLDEVRKGSSDKDQIIDALQEENARLKESEV